ncbi:hypothetical protein DID78_01890 [Candidatus Marinamargulisbacteria bacterium SCGC AG-343-D04]|nr:hypothetical protein DID78_01890 [Candidatus Marinamargulisbacteria bacterium SCGC AG-343-D04]
MAEKQKKPQVILKRQVVTKAVVTERFKSFLKHELKENISFYKNKINENETKLLSLDSNDPAAHQLNAEINDAKKYVNSENEQTGFIEELKLNSLYSQGPVDGFVTVSVGDNLYEKLGGVEVVVEDGVVQKISASPSQFDKITAS